jgi:8-oxo-dGTP pyrophosphatase MutT (NUDIX family)
VLCVERHVKSGFLGGALVFPGGKVDAGDRDEAWRAVTTGAVARPFDAAEAPGDARAFGVAACREALEEAAILLAASDDVDHAHAVALREALAKDKGALRDALATRGLSLDLAALHPFARWVTPEAEGRRFDTRFFLARAPTGQTGAHDAFETTASFWGAPAEVLARFDAGEVQLAPPTHRCLELLATVTSTEEACALAGDLDLAPICPKLVTAKGATDGALDTMALVLPGDPEHDVREVRVPGLTRFVLRGDKWLPEGAPGGR